MLSTNLLAIAIQAKISTLLIGPPGIGKTAILTALVAQIRDRKYGGEHFPLVITNAAQAMPEDLGGAQVPNHADKTMDSYAMGAIKELIKAGRGVHFLDEYGSVGPQMRAACLSIFEGHQYGDRHLPNIAVVAAMNDPSIATNGQDMSLPELNRPFHLRWELDDGQWFDWLRGGEGAVASFPILPEDYTKTHLPKARNFVAMFLKLHPTLIHVEPAAGVQSAWPSKRSWTNAAHLLSAVLACGFQLSSDEVNAVMRGFVGSSAADEFFAWFRLMDLPDPEALLANPKTSFATIPVRQDRAIACLESVAAAAIEHRDNPAERIARWNAAWEVLEPVINTHQDRAMSAATILARGGPPGARPPLIGNKILKHRQDMGVSQMVSKDKK